MTDQLGLFDESATKTPCETEGCDRAAATRIHVDGAWKALCQPHYADAARPAPPDFDAPAAATARDAGMALAASGVDVEWNTLADEAIVHAARLNEILSADNVWPILDLWDVPRPADKRALGPRMTAAAKRGVITKIGAINSKSVKSHGGYISEYRSHLYSELFALDEAANS
jgi:hypothetical protein